MRSDATTPEEYINNLPADRKEAMAKLRSIILGNLPEGFREVMGYGMLGYVVPHEIYPEGYHCNPLLPLPFVNLASQKNFIALYHMGLYNSPELMQWFTDEYKKSTTAKLDIGKSCIRFKKSADIPYDLIGKLMKKISVKQWIENYERDYKK